MTLVSNVICGIDNCSHTSTAFPALYSHIYRHHSNAGIVNRRRDQLQVIQEPSAGVSDAAGVISDVYERLTGIDVLFNYLCVHIRNEYCLVTNISN